MLSLLPLPDLVPQNVKVPVYAVESGIRSMQSPSKLAEHVVDILPLGGNRNSIPNLIGLRLRPSKVLLLISFSRPVFTLEFFVRLLASLMVLGRLGPA
jgi:hypothetical protein